MLPGKILWQQYGPRPLAQLLSGDGQTTISRVLDAKAAELISSLRRREGLSIESETDQFDEMQKGTERDLAISNLHRDSTLLKSVRAARDGLSDGSVGTCRHCEEPISLKRLAAVPWAALCLNCQELADLESNDHQADSASAPTAFGLVRAIRSSLHG